MRRVPLLLVVYLVIGVVVAYAEDYLENVERTKPLLFPRKLCSFPAAGNSSCPGWANLMQRPVAWMTRVPHCEV